MRAFTIKLHEAIKTNQVSIALFQECTTIVGFFRRLCLQTLLSYLKSNLWYSKGNSNFKTIICSMELFFLLFENDI